MDTKNISEIKFGKTAVSQIYLGDQLIYPIKLPLDEYILNGNANQALAFAVHVLADKLEQ